MPRFALLQIVSGIVTVSLLPICAQELPLPASAPKPIPQVPANPNGEQETTVIRLQSLNAADLAPVAKTLLAEDAAEITVDARTNALIVRGKLGTLADKLTTLRALDMTKSSTAPTRNLAVASAPVALSTDDAETRSRRTALADEMAKLDEQVRAAASQVAELQTKFGPEHPDLVAAKDRLRKAVEASFDARQKLQQTEVEHLRRRLQHLENSIALREKVKSEIVTSRVTELLDPSFQWSAPIRTTAPAATPPRVSIPSPVAPAPIARPVPPTSTQRRTMSPAERAKAQARVEVLRKLHSALSALYVGGKMTLEPTFYAERELLMAELELATSSAERRAILEKIIEGQRRVGETVIARFQLGTASVSEKYLAEAELLRTEQMLKAEEAGSNGPQLTSPIPQSNAIPQPSPSRPWKLLDFHDFDDPNASQAAREAQLKLAELDVAAAKQKVEAAKSDVNSLSARSVSEQELRRQQFAVEQAKTELLRAETLFDYYRKALAAQKLAERKPPANSR